MLTWDSVGVTNIFLAVIAFTSLLIILILYRYFSKQ
jgi:hypothetical protein